MIDRNFILGLIVGIVGTYALHRYQASQAS